MITFDTEMLRSFRTYMEERELSGATIANYMNAVRALADFTAGRVAEKRQLIVFKQYLVEKGYAHTSVNAMLAAVNCLLRFTGHVDWTLFYLKIQRNLLTDRRKEISQREYRRLVERAQANGDERLSLLIQTLCALGIRISELPFITYESLETREAVIRLKSKTRVVLIPKRLAQKLLSYCRRKRIGAGAVFVTRSGRPMNRSNIWRMLKRLAKETGVDGARVFPHNFRHLFARTYYSCFRDIVRLADVLGHSSVNTTRIYTDWDFGEQKKRMERLPLVV